MADALTAPVARSPIVPPGPVGIVGGWEVSLARSSAPLTLSDWTPLAKFLSYGSGGPVFGAAVRTGTDLSLGWAPGQALRLAPPGGGMADGEIDLTSALAVLRLTGPQAADLLTRVCALDLAPAGDGSVLRSSVAKVAATLVRDDRGGAASYLIMCDRSFGAYLWDALLDAGAEFGLEATGAADDLAGP